MPVEYLKVADPVFAEERARHGAVESDGYKVIELCALNVRKSRSALPQVPVGVKDAISEDGLHLPVKFRACGMQ